MLFLEHGRAPDAGPARWQDRIEPVWKKVFGNCHLSREVAGAVQAHGFAVEQVGQRYMERTPRFAGFMQWGVGVKPGL